MSESWNTFADPSKLVVMVGGSSWSATSLTCDVAAPSETPGRSPNESDTDGSWPEWLIDCGPTVSSKSTTESSGTSAPVLLLNPIFLQRIGLELVARIELEQDAVLRGGP